MDTKPRAPKPPSSYGHLVLHRSMITQVQRELRRIASFHRRSLPLACDQSTTAAAHVLDGLSFIKGAEGQDAMEDRFNRLTKDQDGVLYRSQFGQCIGMKKMEEKKDGDGKTKDKKGYKMGLCCFFPNRQETGKERTPASAAESNTKPDKPDFAGELFDALHRRRRMAVRGGISKEEMLEFWDQISDTSFKSRLQTFFEMVDKDEDGRISEEEIKQMIMLSASENNLSFQGEAEEYAGLIMDALDARELGYIDLYDLESLLLQQATSLGNTTSRQNFDEISAKFHEFRNFHL
ncbi:unnamed protein product [Urochloa humidicola]